MQPTFPRTKVPCPGCGASLLSCFDDGATLGGCDACGGVWLDTLSSRRLIAAELSLVARELVRLVTTRSAAPKGPAYRAPVAIETRACPACAEPLVKVRLQNPNLDIDVCAAHGSYMDRGEVGAIWDEAWVRVAQEQIAREEEARRAAERGGYNGTRLVVEGAAFLLLTDW